MSEPNSISCPYTKLQILAVCVDGYCQYLFASELNPHSERATKRASLNASTVCNIMDTSKAVVTSIDRGMYRAIYDEACAAEKYDKEEVKQRTASDLVILDKRGDGGEGDNAFRGVKKYVEARLIVVHATAGRESMDFLRLPPKVLRRVCDRVNSYTTGASRVIGADDFARFMRASGLYDIVAAAIVTTPEFEAYTNIYLAELRAALFDKYSADDRLYSAVESAPTLEELIEVHQLDCVRCGGCGSNGSSEHFGESSNLIGSSLLDGIVANAAMLEAGGKWSGESDHKVNIVGQSVDMYILVFVMLAILIITLIICNAHKLTHALGFSGGRASSILNGYYDNAKLGGIGGNFRYGGHDKESSGSTNIIDEDISMFMSVTPSESAPVSESVTPSE